MPSVSLYKFTHFDREGRWESPRTAIFAVVVCKGKWELLCAVKGVEGGGGNWLEVIECSMLLWNIVESG